MDLIIQQEKLHKEAEGVLEELDLLNKLSRIGKPYIVGSVSLGLMTWRDIDIEVEVEKQDKEAILNMITELFRESDRRLDISLVDKSDGADPDFPAGFYIGMKYFGMIKDVREMLSGNENIWKLDIWFILKDNFNGVRQTEEYRQKLTDQKIKSILEIKNVVAKREGYRKKVKSVDIYKAVLDDGVTNLEEFEEYLNTKTS